MEKINKETKQQMEKERQKEDNKFNSITHSLHVENQNQTHNIKKQALGINTKQ